MTGSLARCPHLGEDVLTCSLEDVRTCSLADVLPWSDVVSPSGPRFVLASDLSRDAGLSRRGEASPPRPVAPLGPVLARVPESPLCPRSRDTPSTLSCPKLVMTGASAGTGVGASLCVALSRRPKRRARHISQN